MPRKKGPSDPLLSIGYVCKVGKLDALERLLDRGEDVNATRQGIPLLFLAATQGHNNVIRLLLSRGAEPDGRASLGYLYSPIYATIERDRAKTMRLLVAGGARRHRKEWAGIFLTHACLRGSVACVRFLLSDGVDANARDCSRSPRPDRFPLQATCCGIRAPRLMETRRKREVVLARLLLDHGARVEEGSGYYGRTWRTVLSSAVALRNVDLARLLVERGAAIDHVNNREASHHTLKEIFAPFGGLRALWLLRLRLYAFGAPAHYPPRSARQAIDENEDLLRVILAFLLQK